MTQLEIQSLAQICCAFLVLWEISRRRWIGGFLSVLAMTSLVSVPGKSGSALAIVLALPVVFEERWSRRTAKDWMRACLAAGVIAASASLLLVY